MVNIKSQQLYSITPGAKPSANLVEVGQLWINLADNLLGTKNQDGSIVSFAQLTEEEKETLLSGAGAYIPKQGLASEVTVSMQAGTVAGNTATINDSSNTTLSANLTAEGLTITVNKTTGHKATKLVISKAANVTGAISWNGVDSWLSTAEAPIFGESSEAQELCVAIFTSPSHTAVNVVYNTENPTELDISGVNLGDIGGTLADQADLSSALAAKADISAIPDVSGFATKEELTQAKENASATFAPKANAALTGTATLNGQTIATVNQIPDTSHFVTDTTLANYPTSEMVEAEFSSYDKNIKAHIESELGDYVTETAYASDKETFLTKTEASSTYATQATVANKADASALANYASLAGAAFTGAITVQEPTAASNPATKQYVDSAVSSVYKYKGSVANQSALPSSNQTIGDVYNVEDTGDNFAWDGTQWDKLAGTVDLSSYLTIANAQSTYLPLSGGTVSGGISVAGASSFQSTLTVADPTETKHAANKGYIDTSISALNISQYATTASVNSSLNTKANLASPAFTGTATLNGQNIATANQIPSLSGYLTESTAASTYQPIGDYATVTQLSTKADSSALSNYLPVSGGTVSGNLTVTGTLSGATLSATSDLRLKNILEQVKDVDLSSLNAYRYTFKDDEHRNKHIGLIAQDVQKILPESVITNKETGYLSIEYSALIAILVDKVNRLEKRITELESKS